MKFKKTNFQKLTFIASISLFASINSNITAAQNIFNLQKSNTSFSIDGGAGGKNLRPVYLWNTDSNNVNQQWVEIGRGGGYFSYQKINTNFCLDGGNGGAQRQAVILFACNANNRNQHWKKINTAENSVRLKKRDLNFFIDGSGAVKRRQPIYLSDSKGDNQSQQWLFRSISTPTSKTNNKVGSFGLNPSDKPWENFDLSDWTLDAPNADPSDNLSARTTDIDFANGNLFSGSEPYFFTGSDGAMVFRSNIGGAKTSKDGSFPRSELREMLRPGNGNISTQGVNENNWALGYQPNELELGAHTSDAQKSKPKNIGGREGRLTATLKVNRVTSTGNSSQVGRVIIGQINASSGEPLRLYYRKLPSNSKGSLYFSHEIRNGDDLDDFNLVGSSSNGTSNPTNGIALGQLFSYEITQEGAKIEVIIRDGDSNGPIIGRNSIDMEKINSGYNQDDEWMYFKAGAYTQNSSGNDGDFDEVAFYRLSNTH